MMKSIVFLACFGLLQTAASSQQHGSQPVLTAAPVPQQSSEPPTPLNQAAPAEPSPEAGHPPATIPADVPPGYVIGPEDGVQITVWKEPNLSSSLIVRPDGMISIPLVGDVLASGSTPMELGANLALRLKKYINEPLVTVTVTAVNSRHIFLLGEVQRIGPLTLTPGLTILQAIASAGGLTSYANSKHIYILRGQVKIPFDYKKAVKKGDLQGIVLQPGDTIFVP